MISVVVIIIHHKVPLLLKRFKQASKHPSTLKRNCVNQFNDTTMSINIQRKPAKQSSGNGRKINSDTIFFFLQEILTS